MAMFERGLHREVEHLDDAVRSLTAVLGPIRLRCDPAPDRLSILRLCTLRYGRAVVSSVDFDLATTMESDGFDQFHILLPSDGEVRCAGSSPRRR